MITYIYIRLFPDFRIFRCSSWIVPKGRHGPYIFRGSIRGAEISETVRGRLIHVPGHLARAPQIAYHYPHLPWLNPSGPPDRDRAK